MKTQETTTSSDEAEREETEGQQGEGAKQQSHEGG